MHELALLPADGGSITSIPRGGINLLSQSFSRALTLFILVGACLLVIYITWAGIQMVTSGGDKQKFSAARAKVTSAVIGFILLMLAVFVINAIGYLFKVNLLQVGA